MTKPLKSHSPKQIKSYLQEHFCSLEHLSEVCDISEKQILAYVEAGALPQHSYAWTDKAVVDSSLGQEEYLMHTVYYYHPQHLALLNDFVTWERFMSRQEIAASMHDDFRDRYTAQLQRLNAFEDVLQDVQEPEKFEPLIDKEWQNYLKGIYGLCTKEPSPENIAIKEITLKRIKVLTQDGQKENLNAKEMLNLKQYLDDLDKVLSLFAPHELKRSSRQLWLNDLRLKYGV